MLHCHITKSYDDANSAVKTQERAGRCMKAKTTLRVGARPILEMAVVERTL